MSRELLLIAAKTAALSLFAGVLAVSFLLSQGKTEPGTVLVNSIGINLGSIPAGSFNMGSPPEEQFHQEEENPRKVTIAKPFRISITEVTQKQWNLVLGTNRSDHQGDTLPVERVTWLSALEFCRKLSEKEGQTYRLPTEAEWEYACRAGGSEAIGGSGDLDEMGWFSDNSGGKTQPVGSKKPNAWGLFDMHGNVAEWCADHYAPYPAGDAIDPKGPAEGKSRVVRGGSFDYFPASCRCAARSSCQESYQLNRTGFRIVKEE